MKLSNKVYDILKYIALIVLPAIETLWTTLGQVWDWPLVPQIAATIAAVDLFLGALLKLSSNAYNKEQQPPDEE